MGQSKVLFEESRNDIDMCLCYEEYYISYHIYMNLI